MSDKVNITTVENGTLEGLGQKYPVHQSEKERWYIVNLDESSLYGWLNKCRVRLSPNNA